MKLNTHAAAADDVGKCIGIFEILGCAEKI
jgi:hypothetical protein